MKQAHLYSQGQPATRASNSVLQARHCALTVVIMSPEISDIANAHDAGIGRLDVKQVCWVSFRKQAPLELRDDDGTCWRFACAEHVL